MRLQKLTGLEVEKVVEEYKSLIKHIAHLKILESRSQRMDIIKRELVTLKNNMVMKTCKIVPVDFNFSMEDMIAEEEVVLTVTTKATSKEQL